VEEEPEAIAGHDRDIDFCGHEGAPSERPALFDAADDEGEGSGEVDIDPGVEASGAHGLGGALVDGRDIADAVIGGDLDGPEGAHDDDELHGGFGLAEPEEGEGDPADAGEGLEAEAEDADGIAGPFEASGEEAEGDAEEDAGGVAEEEAFGGDPEGGEEDAAEGVIELEAGGITDVEVEEEFGEAGGVCEEEEDFGGGRDEDWGPAFGGDHEVASVVPDGEESDEKEQGVEEASHGEINRRREIFGTGAISGRG